MKWLLFSLLLPISIWAQDFPIRPVPFTQVQIRSDFWSPRLETNRASTIPFGFQQCTKTQRIDHFAMAAGTKEAEWRGFRADDADIFKMIEGASYSLQTAPDPKLATYLDSLITLIAAAQQPDGYLFTLRQVHERQNKPIPKNHEVGDQRFTALAMGHEEYNAGHLYEAAVAHFQATGKRSLLDIALKNADLMCRTFGPDKLVEVPGHEGIEIGLVKLYRVTGQQKYLDLARFFLDYRGRADVRQLHQLRYPTTYYQDHKPVVEQDEITGHAVRAGYLYAGMADVAALTGDTAYTRAIKRIWTNMAHHKLYLTGGIGPRQKGESLGDAYELPNATAYNETCAAVANMLWNHRMFLLTGESRYIDLLERVLYNGFLSGVSFSGDRFFYANPLASDGKTDFNAHQGNTRAPWFEPTPCCPTNVVRFMPSLGGYVYAQQAGRVYVNLFISGQTSLTVSNIPTTLRQETGYPWQNAVHLTVSPTKPTPFALYMRIPSWAEGHPLDGDLYRYQDSTFRPARLLLNGKIVATRHTGGYVVLDRTWKTGDRVELQLDMPVREVLANPAVADDRNRVAYERGPVVFCAEGIDNGGTTLDLSVAKPPVWSGQALTTLNNVPTLTGMAYRNNQSTSFTLIPYFAWSHRGPGEMAVWFLKR